MTEELAYEIADAIEKEIRKNYKECMKNRTDCQGQKVRKHDVWYVHQIENVRQWCIDIIHGTRSIRVNSRQFKVIRRA